MSKSQNKQKERKNKNNPEINETETRKPNKELMKQKACSLKEQIRLTDPWKT
jgi:hypothetical protein